jgi:hypothetical protein
VPLSFDYGTEKEPLDPKRAFIFLVALVLVLALLSWLPRGVTTTPPSGTAHQAFNATASRGKDVPDYDYLVENGIPGKIARAAVMNPRVMDAVMAEIAERRHSSQ